MHKKLRVRLRVAKDQYRRKIEQSIQNDHIRGVWKGMKTKCFHRGGRGKGIPVKSVFNRFDHPVLHTHLNQAVHCFPPPQTMSKVPPKLQVQME